MVDTEVSFTSLCYIEDHHDDRVWLHRLADIETASYIYRLNQIVRIIVLKIVIVGISISFNTEMVDHLPSEQ